MGETNRRAIEEEEDFELPVSMIDVVFLLLIFFMCASKFKTLEQKLDAKPWTVVTFDQGEWKEYDNDSLLSSTAEGDGGRDSNHYFGGKWLFAQQGASYPEPKGSRMEPYGTIQEAFAAADRSDMELVVAIAEGTYTSLLKNPDYHVFIDRDYYDTKKHRLARGRDKIDKFSDEILKIEDKIITKHKQYADFIVRNNYSVEVVPK